MGTDNDQNQNETAQDRNGLGSDDKAKGAVASGGNEAESSNQTVNPVTTKVERGGSAIDDRAKDFEVVDHPKA